MRGTRGGLLAIAVALAALALLVGNGGAAAGPPPPFLFLEPIANISVPTFVTGSPGDETRLFVVQQSGNIEIVKSGGVVSTFMTVPGVNY
ncbi:MAG TPA: hypothetical protein VH420_05695, partial [Gaiellaceae bacterium]